LLGSLLPGCHFRAFLFLLKKASRSEVGGGGTASSDIKAMK